MSEALYPYYERELLFIRQLAQEFARLVDPARSWQVSLENGRLAWSNHVDGKRLTLHREPDAGLGRRVIAQLLGWLPIEPQL